MIGAADFALFCNPESRRTEGFAMALGRTLQQRPVLIPWQWVLEERAWDERLRTTAGFLRLDSPGRNWAVERLLLDRGAALADEEAHCGWRRLSRPAVQELQNDPGRLLPMRQWFLGWRDVLFKLSLWKNEHASRARWWCPPEDVVRMFDKFACHGFLQSHGFPVPPTLGLPANFDALWELMSRSRVKRVFIKPCHGSSAAGVVALECSSRGIQAFSTLELVESRAGVRLYNRRRVHQYRGAADVRRLVDAICPERCMVEQWVPKAGLCSKTFDLRVVVIGGKARHVMVRLGNGPITNSQLLGGKADAQLVRAKMGARSWNALLSVCEEAMQRCFPESLCAGMDVALEPNFRKARILEINAFGDLLPRILFEGKDTYTCQIEESLRRGPMAQVS